MAEDSSSTKDLEESMDEIVLEKDESPTVEEESRPTEVVIRDEQDKSNTSDTIEQPSEDRPPPVPVENRPPDTPVATLETTANVPSQLMKTTIIHSSDETAEQTFERLKEGVTSGTIEKNHLVDSLFNVLVGGAFDMESRFIISDPSNVERMLKLLDHCSLPVQAEIWSVFVAVVRKSIRNVEVCSKVGLVGILLDKLGTARDLIADLLVQLLAVLANYSITVKETKKYLTVLRANNGQWNGNALKLVEVLNDLPRRDGSDVFFSFYGTSNAGIFFPPLAKFPCQNGWAFSAWIRMDPPNGVTFEKERPYLYCFRSKGGSEYSCQFMGNCLVVSALNKGKMISKCIQTELKPRKWHHVALSHNYSRWGRSDVACYIDGQVAEIIELNWPASVSDSWERCAVGTSPDGQKDCSFCGQMGAVYVFTESITLQQAHSLFCLGAAYQSSFKHEAESDLPEGYKKHLFDGRLYNALLVVYSPKNCHGQLCLLTPPKSTASYFVQIPHALMREDVEVVTTHSIHSSLQSVGGIKVLLPLFDQLDLPLEGNITIEVDICSTLLTLISRLLESSPAFQQQFFHCKGILIISYALQKASNRHLTLRVVEQVTGLAKFLLSCPSGTALLKQLFDHLLFNPGLWIMAHPDVQLHLYEYLATDFLANANFPLLMRRISTMIELCHALKHFYYVVPPQPPSTWEAEPRSELLTPNDVIQIRGAILTFVNRLIIMPSEEGQNKDQEIHTMLNFIATVHENDNLYDVLTLLIRLVAEHPSILIPTLDRDHSLGIVFMLTTSPCLLIRIPALKLLGFFLSRSTLKRKTESVGSANALALLADRLLLHTSHLALPVYNALFEILTEQMTPSIAYNIHMPPNRDSRFENPVLLKVISQLICQSEETEELMRVKKAFLIDMITMCKDNRENRRTILQMSVWQEWLVSLSYVFPSTEAEHEISELVFDMFSILLHHAIRHEYGGWRVWVDTLAIAHSKVSWEKFRRENQLKGRGTMTPEKEVADTVYDMVDCIVKAVDGKPDGNERIDSDSDRPTPIYRTPEFCWSRVHLRLLRDLLSSVEVVVDDWKMGDAQTVSDQLSSSENHVFVANVIHVVSQLADSLIMACGGLLPLLASATSPNSELDIADLLHQQLPVDAAADLLSRFASLADTFLFNSTISFSELEQEKNMPTGGILRESLRLVSTTAVRHILACRERPPVITDEKARAKWDAIGLFVQGALNAKGKEGLIDMEHLLQDIDLQRIKGIVYRDMEETRQAQFLALAVVYLLSVLMVSRYRDILEPPSTPSPFFNSTNKQRNDEKNEDSSGYHLTNGEKANGERKEGGRGDLEPDVAAIRVEPALPKHDNNAHNADDLSRFTRSSSSSAPPAERRAYLTDKLSVALESTAPVLREIMSDFRTFFQKTLLGTHGQEIMNDNKVLDTLRNKNGSVVELVMLLCSQEWQTSLQKHAGLAFIELVNEGRLMAYATRDHVLRVANEADFILNRMRAEDVSKHAQFEGDANEQLSIRRGEETRMANVIRCSRRRDSIVASRLLESTTNVLLGPSGAWNHSNTNNVEQFWRLDVWEDDSRRRLRFVPNPYGTRHLEAAIDSHGAPSDDSDNEEALRRLTGDVVPSKAPAAELVDESDIDKWASEVDPPTATESTSYSTPANLIAPGLVVPGNLSITATDLYFDADEDHPQYKEQDPNVLRYCESLHGRWQLVEIRAVFLRRHLLQNTALELFLASRTAIMFAFADHDTVRAVAQHLPRVGVGVKYGLPQSRKTSLMTPKQLFKHSDMSQRWQKREISNFDYLMFLNTVAGRTFNDLNQYPVFPWILTNYTDKQLDLSVASNFRDLSKPIGALSEARKKTFDERYATWDDPQMPPFHYGTHYSTSAFTLNWLLRVEPFTSMFLHLQSGKLDYPDRMFHSLSETWERCQKDSHDVKELIPELFYLPELFRNSNNLPLGVRHDGQQMGDVSLPPWAKSPEEFVRIHRQALESDLVSCQLNQWIDLIFGYKQKGAEAVRATNVFHYLTYEGSVNLASLTNSTQLEAVQQQICSFGQTPSQLLTEAHPPRHSVMTMSPLMFGRAEEELCMVMKFVSNSPIVFLAANTFVQLPHPTVLSVAANMVFSLNKWHHSYTGNARGSGLSIGDKEAESGGAELPLSVDPLLSAASPSLPPVRRHLGDSLDHRLSISHHNFIATSDSRAIIACGYPDYSFRVIDTDNATVRQVVYGHGDVVTCIARSETSLYSDCYVATGSLDCTVALWHWSGQMGRIAGEMGDANERGVPRAMLTGHDAPISALAVSAEHGLVISGCRDGAIVVHTTGGDLLRRANCPLPITSLSVSRDCLVLSVVGRNRLVVFSSNSRILDEATTWYSVECVCVTRDGEHVVVGSEGGVVALWRLFPLEQLYTYHRTDSPIRSVAVTSNQKFILAGLESGAIVVFNADLARWQYAHQHRMTK